jgi:protein-serine/threonine kinase
VPSQSNGMDAAHFRHMRESQSLQLDLEDQGKGGLVGGELADDGERAKDLFEAFSSVTLHHDGEA